MQEDEKSKRPRQSLPERKFKIGEGVWAKVGELTYYGIIWGHEDGRQIKIPKDCWVYHVALQGTGDDDLGDKVVAEDCLTKLTDQELLGQG